ncbi:MAG: BMP family ABC transporter substrate-binding protein, partial [Chloroflexota bacterium]
MVATRVRLLSLLTAAVVIFGACSNAPGGSAGASGAAPSAAEPSAPAASAAPSEAAPSGSTAASNCTGTGTAAGGADLQIPDVEAGKFNVAMVLIGPHNDNGWSQAHYEGLQYLCDHMPNSHIAYIELVPEGADSEQVFRSLSRKGFNFIIGTSFGYMDPMATVAEEFPDITYLHLTGYKSNGKNFGNFFGAMEDFKYLAGMLAGSRAKKDNNPKIGYMATFPIPEELRLGNGIALGVKQTCPECTIDIRFINTWHDPVKERDAAASLFDAGADVVFTGADTPAVADVAQEKGKWAVTYDHPNSCTVERCLTAPYWIWGPEYVRIAEQVKAKTYKAHY